MLSLFDHQSKFENWMISVISALAAGVVATLAAEACDVKKLIPEFQQLAQLLAEGNTEARKSLEAIVQKMPTAERLLPEQKSLKNQINSYNYKDTTIALDKLVDYLGLGSDRR